MHFKQLNLLQKYFAKVTQSDCLKAFFFCQVCQVMCKIVCYVDFLKFVEAHKSHNNIIGNKV